MPAGREGRWGNGILRDQIGPPPRGEGFMMTKPFSEAQWTSSWLEVQPVDPRDDNRASMWRDLRKRSHNPPCSNTGLNDGFMDHTHGKTEVLKWFSKRLCGSTKNHHTGEPFVVWGTFIGSLKNSLRTWFFREPWFKGSLTHLYRFLNLYCRYTARVNILRWAEGGWGGLRWATVG